MSRDLFSNLLSLYSSRVPEEDFFTEVVGWLLDKNRDILFSWLKESLNIETHYSHYLVNTQVRFDKLESHITASRPDLMITLHDDEGTDYVMIESKLGSREGHDQLPRYADQLAERFPDGRNKYLVYFTRNYDPKDVKSVTNKLKPDVIFKQFRWHEFYSFLQKQKPSSPFLEEILEFMRKKNMAKIERITPATLSAISMFPDVYALFQTVLDEEIIDYYKKVFDQKPKFDLRHMDWRSFDLHHSANNWEFSIGFWMQESWESFPILYAGINLKSSIDSKIYTKIKDTFNQIARDTAVDQLCWQKFDWDDPQPGIELKYSLGDIIKEENHVAAIKNQLLKFLEETKRLLEHYPQLGIDKS